MKSKSIAFRLILITAILLAILIPVIMLIFMPDSGMAEEKDKAEDEQVVASEENAIGDDGSEEKEEQPLEVEETQIEPGYPVSLKYEEYPLSYVYVVVLGKGVNVRKGPSLEEEVLTVAPQYEKLNYVETVTLEGGSQEDTWHHVSWEEEGADQPSFGFVRGDVAVKREFQFSQMEEKLQRADTEIAKGQVTYIDNYRNAKGKAPLYYGKTVDSSGNKRSQSAPGYYSPDDKNNFTYLGDGTLVRRLGVYEDLVQVEVLSGEQYYVPQKYLAAEESATTLTRVIAIDRTNQNEAVYEKIDGQWTLISYTLATTGMEGTYSSPTPLGYYFVIEKKDQFLYYKDGTEEIQGYAPYVLRFAGGAYVHGVPVNYQFREDGTRITPAKREYSATIGTIPLSHKCVRNYTSHAKFLWDWYVQGETIVIVIE